jgi:hypothetical protein
VQAYRLPNGNLMVPRRAQGEGVLGDAWVEVGPDDPDYKKWTDYFERVGREPEPGPEEPKK